MLGIDEQRMKSLNEKDGNIEYLKWLQYEKESNVILLENTFVEEWKAEGGDEIIIEIQDLIN